MRKYLPEVTLFGLDGVDAGRLLQAATICTKSFEFGNVRLLTSIPTRGSSSHPDRAGALDRGLQRFHDQASERMDRYPVRDGHSARRVRPQSGCVDGCVSRVRLHRCPVWGSTAARSWATVGSAS